MSEHSGYKTSRYSIWITSEGITHKFTGTVSLKDVDIWVSWVTKKYVHNAHERAVKMNLPFDPNNIKIKLELH